MTRLSAPRQIVGLIAFIAVSYAAAAIGAIASANAGAFYQQLDRPSWAPPGWVFGPVWTALYATMAVAAWLVWRERGFRDAFAAHCLYFAQLAANALWSWLFFAWKEGAWSFVEILVLWVLIVCTTIAFRRIHALAGALLIPYLAWVTFAAALCFEAWRRNPAALG